MQTDEFFLPILIISSIVITRAQYVSLRSSPFPSPLKEKSRHPRYIVFICPIFSIILFFFSSSFSFPSTCYSNCLVIHCCHGNKLDQTCLIVNLCASCGKYSGFGFSLISVYNDPNRGRKNNLVQFSKVL